MTIRDDGDGDQNRHLEFDVDSESWGRHLVRLAYAIAVDLYGEELALDRLSTWIVQEIKEPTL